MKHNPTKHLRTMALTFVILGAGAVFAVGEGVKDLIERPDGTRSPYVNDPPESVGNGQALETVETAPLNCSLILAVTSENLMEGSPYYNPGLKYVVREYDTNGDKERDAMLLTYPGAKHPLFYIYDIDFDGKPDVRLLDAMLNGTCDGIILDWKRGEVDHRAPHVTPTGRCI